VRACTRVYVRVRSAFHNDLYSWLGLEVYPMTPMYYIMLVAWVNLCAALSSISFQFASKSSRDFVGLHAIRRVNE